MKIRRSLVSVSTAVGILALAPAAQAATITVTATTDEFGTATGCSLREAVQAANTDTAFGGCTAGNGDDIIQVPAGTFVLSLAGSGEDANATGDLDVTTNVRIDGAGARTTFIDGASLDRVFDIDPGDLGRTVAISGLTIRGGAVTGDAGGGISNSGDLTILRVTVRGNTASDFGGGISNFHGNLTLTQSTVAANTSGSSG
jgi:CSLREA domain-containing protein